MLISKIRIIIFVFAISNMQQVMLAVLQNGDYATLRELLMRIPYFYNLHYLLGESSFLQLMQSIEYCQIHRYGCMQLQPGVVYIPLTAGFISSVPLQPKGEKIRRISKQYKARVSMQMPTTPSNQNRDQYINQYDVIDDFSPLSTRIGLFCNTSAKSSLLLHYSPSNISDKITNKIKDGFLEKQKFLSKCSIFEAIDCLAIMDYFHKFQLLQLKFEEILYNRSIRSTKNGQAELHHSDGRSHILEGNPIIGLQKQQAEFAKCHSDRLVCYMIEKVTLTKIITKGTKKTDKLDRSTTQKQVKTPKLSLAQEQFTQIPIQYASKTQSAEKVNMRKKILFQKSVHRCPPAEESEKKLKLRKHFSNFYNQIYEQFSQKKIKHLSQVLQGNEDLTLYKIKIMEKKLPSMQNLKDKLKRKRLEKYSKCKQNVIRSKLHDADGYPKLPIAQLAVGLPIHSSHRNEQKSINFKRNLNKISNVAFNNFVNFYQ